MPPKRKRRRIKIQKCNPWTAYASNENTEYFCSILCGIEKYIVYFAHHSSDTKIRNSEVMSNIKMAVTTEEGFDIFDYCISKNIVTKTQLVALNTCLDALIVQIRIHSIDEKLFMI